MNIPAAQFRTRPLDAVLAGMTEEAVPALPVTGIELDSRRVAPGELFLATPGARCHGLDFASQAVASGAAAVAWDGGDTAPELAVPAIRVPGLAARAGEVASNFHHRPSTRLRVIGITGTDGKTSCAHLLAQALGHRGQRGGYLGTLGGGEPPDLAPAGHTTPDSARLQAWLARMVDDGMAAVALEVSSHALAQERVAGTLFDTAVLTNIGRDHLDYHGSAAAYAAAKRRLFDSPGLGRVVLNGDDACGADWAASLADELDVVTFGLDAETAVPGGRHLHAAAVATRPQGLAVDIDSDWGRLRLESGLLGRFNAANLLAVLAVLLVADVPPVEATRALSRVTTVPGRMEVVATPPTHPLVVVDYAHTADALAQALSTLGEHVAGRVHCVFGCGGERDPGKRPLMGAAAATHADRIWVTDDNPRGESPRTIAEAILAGMAADTDVAVVHERDQAIARALAAAAPDDAVLVAGKGHEREQEVAGRRRPFDDRETARRLLEAPCS